MSDTPRTDAAELIVDLWFISGIQSDWVVMAKFARELERENAALRKALDEAATSLCTISQQAGRTKELEEMSEIRGYAFSRYSAAIDAISAKEGGAS